MHSSFWDVAGLFALPDGAGDKHSGYSFTASTSFFTLLILTCLFKTTSEAPELQALLDQICGE